MKHDTKKNQILGNDLYNVLNDLEKKMIANEGQVYGMRNFIEAKGAESNYQQQLGDCMNMVNAMNQDIVKKTLEMPANPPPAY